MSILPVVGEASDSLPELISGAHQVLLVEDGKPVAVVLDVHSYQELSWRRPYLPRLTMPVSPRFGRSAKLQVRTASTTSNSRLVTSCIASKRSANGRRVDAGQRRSSKGADDREQGGEQDPSAFGAPRMRMRMQRRMSTPAVPVDRQIDVATGSA